MNYFLSKVKSVASSFVACGSLAAEPTFRDLSDKIVLAHKGFFNKECKDFYKENSIEVCRIAGLTDYISIIELDLRKSKDGIVYCHHGSFFEYYFTLKFSKPFSFMRRKYGAASLQELLEVIPESKTVFLDIKDKSIQREDIETVFFGKRFKEVILGNKSASFLRRFDGLPEVFVKILNGNIFCNFYDLRKLKKEGFKYFEVVFPFQIRRRVIRSVEQNGLEFRCSGLFFTKRSYWRVVERYGVKHISSDFI